MMSSNRTPRKAGHTKVSTKPSAVQSLEAALAAPGYGSTLRLVAMAAYAAPITPA
jgi:hypothetical protein